MRLEVNIYDFWEQRRMVTLKLLFVICRRGGRASYVMSVLLIPQFQTHTCWHSALGAARICKHRPLCMEWVIKSTWASQVQHPWPFCALVPFNPHRAGSWTHGINCILYIIHFNDVGYCLIVALSPDLLVDFLKTLYIQESNLIYLEYSIW